jgi:DNA modification methylase
MRPADLDHRPVADLIPYAQNSRTHSEAQIAQLAASITEFGFTNPILVDAKGGIIAGHGRVMAAKSLGLEQVPVLVLDHLTEAQRRAYVIADNKLALNAGWDEDVLRAELEALASEDIGLEITGFGQDELDALLAPSASQAQTDPDDAPEAPEVPTSTLGDVWILGGHRVMCGDSLSMDQVQHLTGSVIPDLANCDPPYGISVVKGATDSGAKAFGKVGGVTAPYGGWKDGDRTKGPARQGRVHGPAKNAIIKPGTYAPIIGDDTIDTAVASYGVLTALGVPIIALWGGNYFANALPNSRCWLIWDKENTGTFADAELAWTNQDKVVKLIRHQWSGLIKASERGERRVHPTQKPVALAEWVMETLAPKALTVIDLFLGSASTLIAAERRGMKCFGMEMSPAYVDVAVTRWQAFTGKTATLESTGQTFAEVAEERKAPNQEAA